MGKWALTVTRPTIGRDFSRTLINFYKMFIPLHCILEALLRLINGCQNEQRAKQLQ